MYTQCPQCKTIFRLRVEQLRCGQGETRCHRCKINFNALAAINPTPENISFFSFDAYRIPTLEENQAVENINMGGTVSDRRQSKRESQHSTENNTKETDAEQTGTQLTTTNGTHHTTAPWGRASQLFPDKPLFWQGGTIALTLLFFSQIILFNGQQLAHSKLFRPFLKTINPWLGDYHNTAELSVLDSKLEPIESADNLLQLYILVKNTAAFPQALPNIKLTLLKPNNQPFASRTFYPSDYQLPQRLDSDTLPPVVITEILLKITDPMQENIGYKFTFL